MRLTTRFPKKPSEVMKLHEFSLISMTSPSRRHFNDASLWFKEVPQELRVTCENFCEGIVLDVRDVLKARGGARWIRVLCRGPFLAPCSHTTRKTLRGAEKSDSWGAGEPKVSNDDRQDTYRYGDDAGLFGRSRTSIRKFVRGTTCSGT